LYSGVGVRGLAEDEVEHSVDSIRVVSFSLASEHSEMLSYSSMSKLDDEDDEFWHSWKCYSGKYIY
jgi:hypothetical protein